MKTIRKLIVLIIPFWRPVILSVLLGCATVLLGLGLMGTSASLIARAALRPSIAELQVAIVGVRFFGIARGVIRYLERLVSHSVNFSLLGRLRTWFYQAVEPLFPNRLDLRTGDLLARAVADIDNLEDFYIRVVAPPVTAFLISLAAGIFIGRFNLWAGLILALGLVVNSFGVPWFIYLISHSPAKKLVEARGQLFNELVDYIQGFPEILTYDQQQRYLNTIQVKINETNNLRNTLAWSGGISAGLNIFFPGFVAWLVFFVAIPAVHSASISGVDLAVITLVVLASFEAAGPLGQAAERLESALASAQRLFELLELPVEVKDPDQPEELKSIQKIEFQSFSFGYDEESCSGSLVLKDVSLLLIPGRRIAIIGESGAGKTTLVNILMRFWEYSSGKVLINAQEIKNYRAGDVRAHISLVSQPVFIFSGSIRQNLKLANPNVSDLEMLEALERVGLSEWVRTLPLGLDTWVGEHGVQISGGERQRLGLARGLLHPGEVLILDEPTANLDVITEQTILKEILDVAQNRAFLMITHRLVGLETMDEILVLKNGRVIERGVHQALIDAGGYYQRMLALQSMVSH
jgi:ATP-binding cassette subfamily C protein CydC